MQKLVTIAKSTVGYVKKVMAHTPSYLDSNKQLPSGNLINNLLDHILDEMWEENLATWKSKKESNFQKWMETLRSKERKVQKIGPSSGILLFVCLLVLLSLNPTLI